MREEHPKGKTTYLVQIAQDRDSGWPGREVGRSPSDLGHSTDQPNRERDPDGRDKDAMIREGSHLEQPTLHV